MLIITISIVIHLHLLRHHMVHTTYLSLLPLYLHLLTLFKYLSYVNHTINH